MNRWLALTFSIAVAAPPLVAASGPVRARSGMVASSDAQASAVGVEVLRGGGSAVDAAVATAFALAVVHPTAGNIGGGGFLLFRDALGTAVAYDFREQAPAGATATMFLKDGRYDSDRHHESALSVGVPGTVAGLHLAWREHGRWPWKSLLMPAIALARSGFPVSDWLARDLVRVRGELERSAASIAQFTKAGTPYAAGDMLKQTDLARTLERIAEAGPTGFYEGETARLLVAEMKARGGLVSEADLRAYQPHKRTPVTGTYRGYEIVSMPPPSSGGIALIEMLNILEGEDLASRGFGSAAAVHLVAEGMRRAYADRARFVGDPDFNPGMPLARLLSKEYAARLRRTISAAHASVSSPERFAWPVESEDTTHVSVVDEDRNAVALTYTLEDDYGSKFVVPGAGFLLNNEMGDFNAGPGLTDATGLVGTDANLAAPGKRMVSSMTPTLVSKDGRLFMALGAAGGRRIINTVLQVILNVVDFGMNVREAVEAPRFHHQWLPDRIMIETNGLSPDTQALLRAKGHTLKLGWDYPSRCQAILADQDGFLAGVADPRNPDAAAAGY
jgi:gamma-glutamyltranspeptidase / glutathione hydrolase